MESPELFNILSNARRAGTDVDPSVVEFAKFMVASHLEAAMNMIQGAIVDGDEMISKMTMQDIIDHVKDMAQDDLADMFNYVRDAAIKQIDSGSFSWKMEVSKISFTPVDNNN
jgi:hypothetical protein